MPAGGPWTWRRRPAASRWHSWRGSGTKAHTCCAFVVSTCRRLGRGSRMGLSRAPSLRFGIFHIAKVPCGTLVELQRIQNLPDLAYRAIIEVLPLRLKRYPGNVAQASAAIAQRAFSDAPALTRLEARWFRCCTSSLSKCRPPSRSDVYFGSWSEAEKAERQLSGHALTGDPPPPGP